MQRDRTERGGVGALAHLDVCLSGEIDRGGRCAQESKNSFDAS